MRQLRAAIAARLEDGDTLDTVERQLIAPSRPLDEQQSALWLYAWSLPKRPAASEPPPPIWAALGNTLATLVGIIRQGARCRFPPTRRAPPRARITPAFA